MSTSNSSEPTPFPEQRAVVLQVLRAVCPLETDLLGPTTVENILAGKEFKPVQGGRHFDLSTTIALVSCVSSLTQLAIKAWEIRRSEKDREVANVELADERRARAAISEYVVLHPELTGILSEHSQIPEQVIDAVKSILGTE